MEANGKYTAIYARVSSRQQSIESQMPELKAKAAQLEADGERIVWIEDNYTGRQMKRPGMDRLRHDIEDGRVKAVVCWRLDRLGRTAQGLCKLFEDLRKAGVNLISIREGMDLSTASGKLIAQIMASVAEFETEVRHERQAAGISAAKQRLAEVLRLADGGWTAEAIARRLNLKVAQVKRAILTRRGWWGGSIKGRPRKPLPPDADINAWIAAGMSPVQIANACGVSRPTIYKRFPIKEMQRRARADRKARNAAGIRSENAKSV